MTPMRGVAKSGRRRAASVSSLTMTVLDRGAAKTSVKSAAVRKSVNFMMNKFPKKKKIITKDKGGEEQS